VVSRLYSINGVYQEPKIYTGTVSALVNFLNLDGDDPNDMGITGVDIFKFNPDVKIVEHCNVLHEVPNSAKAANTNGMF
jgi:predicted SnoaL-like aldol condensation-catalyzing enzyme